VITFKTPIKAEDALQQGEIVAAVAIPGDEKAQYAPVPADTKLGGNIIALMGEPFDGRHFSYKTLEEATAATGEGELIVEIVCQSGEELFSRFAPIGLRIADLVGCEGVAILNARWRELFGPNAPSIVPDPEEPTDEFVPDPEVEPTKEWKGPKVSIPVEERPCYRVFEEWTVVEEHGEKPLAPGVWFLSYKEAEKKGVTFSKVQICSPLYVKAVASDASGDNYGRLLRFRATKGRWVMWSMPMVLLAGNGDELRANLLDRGVEINPDGKQLLSKYIISHHPKDQLTCTSQVGWCDNNGTLTYMLPDRAFGAFAQSMVFQREGNERADYGVRGSIKGWQDGVAKYAIGNPVLGFALSIAFVGPLLKLCGSENCGVHMIAGSSQGKTTAQWGAAAVWGQPDKQMKTWNATANGLEGNAFLYNDNMLALDEINQCGNPKDVGKIIYDLMNGTGKSRAGRTGLARPSKGWRLFVLSSGERGTATVIEQAGGQVKAGQEVRMINISVERKFGIYDNLHGFAGAALVTAIRNAAKENYGHAGRVFLEQLVKDRRDWQAWWQAYKDDPRFEPLSADGQDSRVAGRFALIALAGETAIEYGVLPWEPGQAIEATKAMFEVWKAGRVAGNSEPRQIKEKVQAFIDREESRFEPEYVTDKFTPRERAGWKGNDDGIFEFTTDGLKEATEGFDFNRALDVFVECGALLVGKDGRKSKSKKVNGRSTRVYPVDTSKL
jgi:putative DNA primase/helicase